jgi:hypothetical protein
MLRSKLVASFARASSLSKNRPASASFTVVECRRRLLSGKRDDNVIVPGMRQGHEYGSLDGDLHTGPGHQDQAVPWQASHNVDVQRVTQKAIV